MKHKAKTWNYCWPDDTQPGLLHLEPPALSGEATFWVQCGGGTSEEQNKIADRIAALWNMAERLGLSTEDIKTKESMFSAAPDMLEALESVLSLIDESLGVAGFHLNGDVATWGELALREELEAAIRKARGKE